MNERLFGVLAKYPGEERQVGKASAPGRSDRHPFPAAIVCTEDAHPALGGSSYAPFPT